MAGTAEGARKASEAREARAQKVTEQVPGQVTVEEAVAEAEDPALPIVRTAEAQEALDAATARVEAKFGRRGRPSLGSPLYYVVGRRPLLMGDDVLPIGAEVPGAATWPRVEAWVRAGRIVPVFAEVALEAV